MTQEQSGVEHFLHSPDGSSLGKNSATGPGSSVGASLRALRETRRWSQADVSARLKFSVKQIDALESENWDELPHGPSLRGLVRNYARLLDVDPDTLMNAMPESLRHRPGPVLSAVGGELPAGALRYRDGSATRRRVWPKVILAFFFICLVGLAAYLVFEWWLPRSSGADTAESVGLPLAIQEMAPDTASGAAPEASPEPGDRGAIETPGAVEPVAQGSNAPLQEAAPPATTPVPAPASPAAQTAIPVAPQAGATVPPLPDGPIVPLQSLGQGTAGGAMGAGLAEGDPTAPAPTEVLGNVVGFEVQSPSWIEVRDASGAVQLSATLQAGAKEQIDVQAPARIVIGNAGGVTLSWRGAPVDLAPHQRGNVARLTLE